MPDRNGKPLRNVPPGDRRRLSDARNAWRKMTAEQRRVFLDWAADENLPVALGGEYGIVQLSSLVTE